ncbi:glycosyltransferase family 4 protein [Paenibacillus polygoni]|uniref:Glycosyltransferase family 4 protein n=1 Tax=Paenibacillus polygoni TaxID=3050112 RepID=A0ABY8X6B3_9BACL|nr:glycosyltransferase family 4 protein [Paenibacillus polygoni]WIV20007.1 glycosyltransferase family 4 protein [Paenibacillus polygoni]
MKKVLILANHFITIYAFRKELISELLETGIKVYLSIPKSDENDYFREMGCEIIETPIERRSTNPISDFKLMYKYVKIIREIKPELVMTYTIKPNTYGGIAARICRSKTIHTVTGLGSVYIQDMWQKKIAIVLNKIGFKTATKIFFLNDHNEEFYKQIGIINDSNETITVPGSGVNLERFKYVESLNKKKTIFTFVGRVLKDKGIEEFLLAAEEILLEYNDIKFQVVGFVDEAKYVTLLEKYQKMGVIKYLGKRNDIPSIMEKSSCIVLPSYGEGRGTVLQEGAAIGRPLITCNTYGCKDNVDDEYNGFLCNVADVQSLKNAMMKFIRMSEEDRDLMGKRSREKAVKEFDRKIVIEKYMEEIKKIL